ncbi:MAG: hypothetical protein IT381_14840 [Deltaproteobacteria bacterium]|nr:hypothetical protein [Deltaproteobacteria bacterium]
MTWTYTNTLLTDRDKIRFEIQDTDTNDQLFSDEEIAARLTALGSVSATVLDLAKKLLMKFARLVDVTVGKVSESNSQRYQAYKDIVARLEAEGAAYALPSFGGVNVDANETLDEDETLVQPGAKRGDIDNVADGNGFGGGQ